METRQRPVPIRAGVLAAGIALLVAAWPATAGHLRGAGATYTDDADFDEGRAISVVHSTPGQLELDDSTEPFPFIWVAVSSKGTVVKIDTRTGAIKGEYFTSPTGRSRDPSRTTVDKNGNVWVANRAESASTPASGLLRSGASGSLVHLGLQENGQCVDRDGNGTIETSTGFGDIRGWPNGGGADNLGGVSTAEDECVLHYVRVNSTGTRHVSVTTDNDVWVSGTGERHFDLLDGDTGTILRAETSVSCGGYGGLIDASGVIWSARPLLRWDTANPLTTGNYTCYAHDSYGLGIDPAGNVWNTQLSGNLVRKFDPAGIQIGAFPHGAANAQGVVADRNGDIWVAHSLFGPASVGHLRNDGTFVGNVVVGGLPTGVSVDAAGKVWSTHYDTGTVSRIDPAAAAGIGLADLETRPLGGQLYNYSDMTGSVLPGVPTFGTWTVVHDGGTPGYLWDTITWNAGVPAGADLQVTAVSSESASAFGPSVPVTSGGALGVAAGRYLKVTVSFVRAATGESPVLYDLTIGRKDSAIEAHPALLEATVPGSAEAPVALAATLTATSTGLPLAGRTVEFFATGLDEVRDLVCTAATDAGGNASCTGLLEVAAAVEGLGYEAVFAGDELYLGSDDEGPIVSAQGELP